MLYLGPILFRTTFNRIKKFGGRGGSADLGGHLSARAPSFRPILLRQEVSLSLGQVRLDQVSLGWVRIGRNGLDEMDWTKTGWPK